MPIEMAEKNQEHLRIGGGPIVIRVGLSPRASQSITDVAKSQAPIYIHEEIESRSISRDVG